MTEADIIAGFSATYAEARGQFLDACASRGLTVDSRHNPNAKGAGGEELFSDIARIGPDDAKRALLLISGTHGVEGYCGSGAQVGLLRSGFFESLPADTCVVLLHALNPYGFSHDRRVNEDNVDMNRNFIDWDNPARPTSAYPDIHEFVLPADWEGPARDAADKAIAAYIEDHGMTAYQAAISSGQYVHPDGVFYGGTGPTWSNRMLQSVLSAYLSDMEMVGVIDWHTGLGPYGYGELITVGTDAQKALAAKWYDGDVTDPDAGTSTSAPLDGVNATGIARWLPNAEIAFVAAEFGTRDLDTVLNSLRADNWLYLKGDVASEQGQAIKRSVRDAFYCDEDDWKGAIWARSTQVVGMALSALGNSGDPQAFWPAALR